MTSEITYTGNVNVNEVGTYKIIYKVTDSHNNETSLMVPVIVTDDDDAKINVERTLYTIPSVWNMDLAGYSRCNYGDRQILGVFIGDNQSIRARIISSDVNIGIHIFNNDSATETSHTLKTTGEWVNLTNSVKGISYQGVPVLTSPVLSREKTEINKTYKIELEYDENIAPLQYYHYQDDEEKFRENWLESGNSYGVIENEVMTVIVPLGDINKLTNYYSKGFKSLDQFLEYYKKAVDKMDEYVGLDLNPEKVTDQNVRTKYLVRANIHGAGAAYYAGNHVGIHNSSIAAFFEMNWGGLHEFAHGYQGSLGKGQMQLGEVANNIIGHYIQIDKSIYFHSGDWLGSMPKIEDSKNVGRLSGKTFIEQDVSTRLYAIINLFDTFEGGKTYAKMFSWYREQLNNGNTGMTNQEAYAKSIADIYHVNIIPYMDAWGLSLSDTIKDDIYSKNYPIMSILKDVVKYDSLNTIMNVEGLKYKYGLVTNDNLSKSGITANLKLTIDIDDIKNIQGKYILIKDENKIVKRVQVTGNELVIDGLPIGAYYLQMPVNSNYLQENLYVQIKEGQDNSYTYQYTKLEDVNYDNYLYMRLLGFNFDTIGATLTFKDNYQKVNISLGQAGMSGNEYFKIYNNSGELVTEEVTSGGYFNYKKGSYDVDLRPGYIIEVNYPRKWGNKVRVYSTLTNQEVIEYRATGVTTKYVVVENGLKLEGMSKDTSDELAYLNLKTKLMSIIDAYKAKATDEELDNKLINFREKSTILSAYNNLRAEDRKIYTNLVTRIKQGGFPKISVIGKLDYSVFENINLYSLIRAIDNEDGAIVIDRQSTKVETNLDIKVPGIYKVVYKVADSDNNVTVHTLEVNVKGKEENVTPDSDNNDSSDDIKQDEDNKQETLKPDEIIDNINGNVGNVNTNTTTGVDFPLNSKVEEDSNSVHDNNPLEDTESNQKEEIQDDNISSEIDAVESGEYNNLSQSNKNSNMWVILILFIIILVVGIIIIIF